ncbi:MAG: signal peptide peptidase SppA [Firmicutes bacterium]|nr:signal peptide peptidase SppA [Bacillota bacterium]
MKRKLVAGVMIGLAVLLLAAVAVLQPRDGLKSVGGEGVIGVINISGTIVSGPSASGLFDTVTGADDIMAQLRSAAADQSVKAVVLRMNTPGGTSAASQEIALEVDRLRQAGKKVVVSMGDVTASGGYWIASRCDRIVANPGSLTGSIGVIMETTDTQGLYEKIGLSATVFKSGAHKDMGSSTRDVTPDERVIFQGLVDDIYRQFVDTVAQGRKMERGQVLKLADGRVFTGSQAQKNGLVDELGDYYDAVAVASRLAGLGKDPTVIDLTPKHPFWETVTGVNLPGGIGSSAASRPAVWLLYAPAAG